SATDPDDLTRQDTGKLLAALRRSHERVKSSVAGMTRIVATPPQGPGEPLVLDIISPDMPFIVDSTLAALRSMGGVVRLFAHPVVRIDGTDGAVSVLHIHSDPVADTDALVDEIEATLTDVNRAVADWHNMLEQVRRARTALAEVQSPQ